MTKNTASAAGGAMPAKGPLRLVACAPSPATPPIKETLPPGRHWTDAAIEKHGDLGTLRLIADMRQFAAVVRADAKFAKRESKRRAAGEFVFSDNLSDAADNIEQRLRAKRPQAYAAMRWHLPAGAALVHDEPALAAQPG